MTLPPRLSDDDLATQLRVAEKAATAAENLLRHAHLEYVDAVAESERASSSQYELQRHLISTRESLESAARDAAAAAAKFNQAALSRAAIPTQRLIAVPSARQAADDELSTAKKAAEQATASAGRAMLQATEEARLRELADQAAEQAKSSLDSAQVASRNAATAATAAQEAAKVPRSGPPNGAADESAVLEAAAIQRASVVLGQTVQRLRRIKSELSQVFQVATPKTWHKQGFLLTEELEDVCLRLAAIDPRADQQP